MKIKTITYRRIKNLGNYNSEHEEMSAELEDGECPVKAALKLKETVLISLDLIEAEEKPSTNTDDDDLDKLPF